MRIAVYGSGGVGAYFGGRLAQGIPSGGIVMQRSIESRYYAADAYTAWNGTTLLSESEPFRYADRDDNIVHPAVEGDSWFTLAEMCASTGKAETAIEAYRKRHSELYQGWTGGRVSPRTLRLDLVDFYSSKGQREIDQRFFGDGK